jgi:hypothetical protein
MVGDHTRANLSVILSRYDLMGKSGFIKEFAHVNKRSIILIDQLFVLLSGF